MKINLDLAALEAAEFDLRMGKIGDETVFRLGITITINLTLIEFNVHFV